jgi:hypothetical protein
LQALAPAAEVVLLGELGGVGLDQILRMGCAEQNHLGDGATS